MAATTTASAQDSRQSSSQYLQAAEKADVTLSFGINAEGKRYEPTWGLDLAWISDRNIRMGVNHMGKENVGIGRTSFRVFNPLVNDKDLTEDQIEGLKTRSDMFSEIVSPTLPLVLNCDNGYAPTEDYKGTHINTYYTQNRNANIEHWAKAIEAHVAWMKQNTKHPIVGVSPFNEPDFDGNSGELIQGTTANQRDVAKMLKTYPSMEDIIMAGGNTLNNDKAMNWYTTGKEYYDWGNTHQLAGSFDNFAAFYQQVAKDGKVGYGDEMHNVAEAMVGLEYGMTVGIWWGFDSRARGEFCQISRHGKRLSYAEHRNNWTAASVWRHDDGRVKAFIGSSERQAATTSYQLVSTERDVYYDGFGPQREYNVVLPGGTGYQKGQTNAERVVDITWGEDVPVAPVTSGVYRLWNRSVTDKVLAAVGGDIKMSKYSVATGTMKTQTWNITPATNRALGDLSFYDIESVSDSKLRMNVLNHSTESGANVLAYNKNEVPDINEQWYLEYVGNGYYYIRSRVSALYLAVNGDNVIQMVLPANPTAANTMKMQWKILPQDVKLDLIPIMKVTGLQAEVHAASVTLTWTAKTDKDLAGHVILRKEKGGEEWNTVGRTGIEPTFTDNTCQQGVTYIYKVKAFDKSQNRIADSPSDETIEATPTGEHSLIAHWKMDDNLTDATANIMDAKGAGTMEYIDGHDGKAVYLLATKNQYVQLPYQVANSKELTVAMWVNPRITTGWQRLFDFGNDTDHYMFLTPSNGNNKMVFGIKNGGEEQKVECQKLMPGQWKHVAVTIGDNKVTIYVDGEQQVTANISITPADIRPVMNYIGRSQFVADQLLTAYVDDVRIYNYSLAADDVKTIMNGGELTKINANKTNVPEQQHIYGLDGTKRNKMQRGINIVGGRKVLTISEKNVAR